jgi:hypothetical protein
VKINGFGTSKHHPLSRFYNKNATFQRLVSLVNEDEKRI